MEELSVVGKPIPRLEGREKVVGSAQYVADLSLPGMLWGRVLRSPYPHARILHIDTNRAEALPGVKAVVTAADSPKVKWGAFIKDMYPLALEKVRYVGEEVAAVAAVDEETALEALDLIEVEYEELPALFDPEEAMAPGAHLIHEAERNIALEYHIQRGDVQQGFAQSHCILEETFTTPFQYHAWMEPIGSVASFSSSGKLTLWMNTQTLFMARQRIALALGMREGDIRIIQPEVGGGYGGKSCDDNNAMVCALLARKARRPVKLIDTHEEEFLASRPRVATRIHLKMGFSREGSILAKETRILCDNGAYSGKAPGMLGVIAQRVDNLYRQTNLRTDAFLVYTNKTPTGAFRGFGNETMHFALESMMEMAAQKLDLDPLELRLRNVTQPGDVTIHGSRIGSCALSSCLTQAAQRLGWQEKRAQRQPGRGLGLSCMVHVSGRRHFGDYDGSSAMIKVNEDGKAYIWSGEGEIGQGAKTVLCQIAAEEMGLPIEDLEISQADTDLTTYCHGAYASRLTYIAGNAVRAAAKEVKRQLLGVAAEMLEASPEDLEAKAGRIWVKGSPARGVTVKEAARARLYRQGGAPIVAVGTFDPPSELADPNTRYGNESGAYTFGAHAAELEVDRETGQVRILNYVAANDAGTVVNPMLAEGQVQGAFAQGLGFALIEEAVMEEGRSVNPNLADYKIPACTDMPPFQTLFADSHEPTGPFGAKGLGEPGMVPTAAAIANAVFDAVGVRITALPITPEKILKALRGG